MATEVPSLASLLPSPRSQTKRADLLNLKLRLATLLSKEDGTTYWNALVEFCTGKLNRIEFGVILEKVLGTDTEAVQLHNALLLSILYNTTKSTLPPSSLRHIGWQKRRKRDASGQKIDNGDPKKRKLKATIMAIGKFERGELKSNGMGSSTEELITEGNLRASLDSKGAKIGENGVPFALDESPNAEELRQEYVRCLSTPTCCEEKHLPDNETMRDRMNLLALDSGLLEGVDSRTASLCTEALEVHLKSLINSALALVRSNRKNGIQSDQSTFLNHLATISDTAMEFKPEDSNLPTPPIDSTSLPIATNEFEPISTFDLSSLFEISPHLLIDHHLAGIEKLYALAPPSPPASDDEGEVESMEIEKQGRHKYIIDPSSIQIPLGHPAVTFYHSLSGSLSLPSSSESATAQNPNQLSPNSLQNQLFPESSSTAVVSSGISMRQNITSRKEKKALRKKELNESSSESEVEEGGKSRAGLYDVCHSGLLLEDVF